MSFRLMPAMPAEDVHRRVPEPWDGDEGLNSEVELRAPVPANLEPLVSDSALAFVAEMTRRFGPRRTELLDARREFHRAIARGDRPEFLPETKRIREGRWSVAKPPRDLAGRRVEITGPPERKMVIHALNSGADAYMADFEDSMSPRWSNLLEGQANVYDAVRRTIAWASPDGRVFTLGDRPATLMVRPRGWHLEERHLTVDGEPVPASLFDFGLFVFHNGVELRRRGTGPYLYLPKLEHHREAALWNDICAFSEQRLGLSRASIRATVLIETLPAAFQMEEILHALRSRSLGLNGGRWDYIFSFVKEHRDAPELRLPDRGSLLMTAPFLDAWARLLVATCHRRGAAAIGGMAAEIPLKDNPTANEAALRRVTADKERELDQGFDGTWVAHPGLVPVAVGVFETAKRRPGRPRRTARAAPPGPGELLELPKGPVTTAGVRSNVRVALRYLTAWFDGTGCVPIDQRMEDAATVEIARALLWHWVRRGAATDDGPVVTSEFVRSLLAEEARSLRDEVARARTYSVSIERAAQWVDRLATGAEFPSFFPLAVGLDLED